MFFLGGLWREEGDANVEVSLVVAVEIGVGRFWGVEFQEWTFRHIEQQK